MHQVYRELQPIFHVFPVPGMVLGLEFSRVKDALYFSTLINQFCPKCDRPVDSELQYLAQEVFQTEEENRCFSRPTNCTQVDLPWFNTITQTFNLKEMPQEIKIIIK